MTLILQITFLIAFFVNENIWNSIIISIQFVPEGSIVNKSALIQVMAWCRTGDKPLPEPMLTKSPDAYMQY